MDSEILNSKAEYYWRKALRLKAPRQKRRLYRAVNAAMYFSPEVHPLENFFPARLPDEKEGLRPFGRALASLENLLRRGIHPAWVLAYRAMIYERPWVNRYDKALEDLERAARLKPRCAWIQTFLARSLARLSRPEAGRVFNRAVSLSPGCGWIRAWRGFWVLQATGDFKKALHDLDLSARRAPEYTMGRAWRGKALRLAGRFREAEEDLLAAIRSEPARGIFFESFYDWSYAELARLYSQMHRWPEAARAWARAYERNPKHRMPKEDIYAAFHELPTDLFVRAWKALERMEAGGPGPVDFDSQEAASGRDAFLHHVVGILCQQQGRMRQAEKHLDEAARLKDAALYWAALGRHYFLKGAFREAVQNLERACGKNAVQAPFLALLGASYLACGKPGLALARLDRALSLDSGFFQAQFLRLQTVSQARISAPRKKLYAQEALTMAQRLHSEGRHQEALKLSRGILSILPKFRPAALLSLEAWTALGEPLKAAAALKRMERYFPKDTALVVEMGWSLLKAGRFSSAIAAGAKALRVNASYVEARWLKAEALRNLGKFQEAAREVLTGLALKPDSGYGRLVLAKIKRQMGDLKGALQETDRALKLEPDNAKMLGWRGEILRKMGRRAEALKILDAAVCQEPNCGWIAALRGELKAEMGKAKAGLEDLNRALHLERGCACAVDFLGREPSLVRQDKAYAWVYAWRGHARALRRDPEARKDAEWSRKLNPGSLWVKALSRKGALLFEVSAKLDGSTADSRS